LLTNIFRAFILFLNESNRRRVLRALIAYLAFAWLIIQIAAVLFPVFQLGVGMTRLLVYVLLIGFFIWMVFSWYYDITPQGIERTIVQDEHEEEVVELPNLQTLGILSASVVILLVLSFWAGIQFSTAKSLSVDQGKIAVLPFQVSSSTYNEGEIEESWTQFLINELAHVNEFTVLDLLSSQKISRQTQQMGILFQNEFNEIDYYVSASLEHDTDRIQGEITLRDSFEPDSEILWKKYYEEDISQIKGLMAQITIDIARELNVEIDEDILDLLENREPILPEVARLCQKGYYYLNKSTEEDWTRGITYFEQAKDENPSYSFAWSGMAKGYISLAHSLFPPEDAFEKAKAAADRAIVLDRDNAEGWAALAHYETYFGRNWNLAEKAFHKSNELQPSLAYNHYHRAWFLALFGKMEEAIDEHILARRIDPFSMLHTAWLAELYRMAGDYQAGLKEADRAIELVRVNQEEGALAYFVKGRILIDMGEHEEGLDYLRKSGEINYGYKYLGLAPALFELGRNQEAEDILNDMMEESPSSFLSLCLAITYFAKGDDTNGFEYLETAKEHAFYPWIRVMFLDKRLRKDPRFLELIRELNLPYPTSIQYKGRS
jgi:tetratricopeptide (TPR) repeat protein